MKNRFVISLFSLLLVCALTLNLSGCGTTVHAENLMNGIEARQIPDKTADDAFTASQMELSMKLFKASVNESRDENVLISPLSIQLALAMAANGADGKTLMEMENLIGGGLSITELNEYLHTYVKSLPSESKMKLEIANSIWFLGIEHELQVERDFLQTNADYFNAEIYKSEFDAETLKDINNWVKDHTDGMIDKIMDEIKLEAVMYLINAMVFDAEWEETYKKSDIGDGIFISASGEQRNIKMMHSEEKKYLEDGKATGFIKSYKDDRYSFAAMLPNDGVDIYDYIEGLTADGMQKTLKDAKSGLVTTTVPKFSCEYELTMNNALKKLGMTAAFEDITADFSKMAHSIEGEIYIGDVVHKTFISVDENGTKAGAVTKVEMRAEYKIVSEWNVCLDRPFVYMIIDNSTDLPLFIGTVLDVGE